MDLELEVYTRKLTGVEIDSLAEEYVRLIPRVAFNELEGLRQQFRKAIQDDASYSAFSEAVRVKLAAEANAKVYREEWGEEEGYPFDPEEFDY